jgi:hypothetical protein
MMNKLTRELQRTVQRNPQANAQGVCLPGLIWPVILRLAKGYIAKAPPKIIACPKI